MTDSRRRPADPYGRPQPHLVSPTPPIERLHSERNDMLRRYLLALLEQDYAPLFQHGVHADVHVSLQIQDGTLQPGIDITVVRHHQLERETR